MAYTISDNCIGCRACARICPSLAVTGEKKQIHEIDPDTCIECGACGRVCPSAAILDPFGLVAEKIPKSDWKIPEFNLDLCMSCTICADNCPTSAIIQALQIRGNPHLFPQLKAEGPCIGCGFCADDCPVEAITMVSGRQKEKA